MNFILIIILTIIMMILAWAIFSNKPVAQVENKSAADKNENDEPERILRRRSADKAIEKEYPVERIKAESAGENLYEKEDIAGQLQLPFPPNEIISDSSRFKIYKRALINSEIYAKRGDIETAISLFNGVKERILDNDIRSKIESDINYLNHFRHRRDADFKKKVESASNVQPGAGELRLRIDGPVPQTINIGMPEKSIINTDDIINKLSDQISRELGTLKNDIDKLKAKPEEKFEIDDFARFSNLQQEFNTLKEHFRDLTDKQADTLKELNDLRIRKEDELRIEQMKDQSPENSRMLQEIRKDIDNLSNLKHSLDSLHAKIENISNFNIPESKIQPAIVQAKFDSQLPLHEKPELLPDIAEPVIEQIEEEDSTPVLTDEPETDLKEDVTEDVTADIIEQIAENVSKDELDDTAEHIEEHIIIEEPDDTSAFTEELPVIDEPVETAEITEEQTITDEPDLQPEELLKEELPHDQQIDLPEEQQSEIVTPDEIIETVKSAPDEKEKDEAEAEQILKSEKEKEIEKHVDAEEDPNAFDLVSEMGKVKDDSTLSDEDIFEKILKDEKNKNDDAAFEIIGDIHKDDQEISFNNSILDGKRKAEQDFYKKFIKADRIKKKELPILKVSYDFKKLPDEFSLSREKNILEYSFYKYKPMLQKADDFIKHRHVRDAINYYKVVMSQNIPIEFKAMIKKNINDLTEYLEKYLSSD